MYCSFAILEAADLQRVLELKKIAHTTGNVYCIANRTGVIDRNVLEPSMRRGHVFLVGDPG